MSNSTLTINVTLPSDFLSLLDEEIDNELASAQAKWKIKLTEAQIDTVKTATREQLRSKVSTLSKNTWDLGVKLTISASGGNGTLAITSKSKPNGDTSLLLNKNGWSVTNEEADSVFHINDLYSELLKSIFTWTKTAVFYGVGSYAAR